MSPFLILAYFLIVACLPSFYEIYDKVRSEMFLKTYPDIFSTLWILQVKKSLMPSAASSSNSSKSKSVPATPLSPNRTFQSGIRNSENSSATLNGIQSSPGKKVKLWIFCSREYNKWSFFSSNHQAPFKFLQRKSKTVLLNKSRASSQERSARLNGSTRGSPRKQKSKVWQIR